MVCQFTMWWYNKQRSRAVSRRVSRVRSADEALTGHRRENGSWMLLTETLHVLETQWIG